MGERGDPSWHPPTLGTSCASRRRTSAEPARRIELRLPPYRGGVLPLPLGRHELGAQDSNLKPAAPNCQLSYRPPGAATRGRTGPSAVRRRSRKPCAAARIPGQDSDHQRPRSSGSHRNSWGTRIRTWMNVTVSRFRAGRVTSYTIPHHCPAAVCGRYAGRDSNPRTAEFEPASFAG